jgi:ureidoacrylate peracid hydrolase
MVDFKLDPKETAVVFIEYQNEFTTENGKLHEAVKEVMDQTNMLENSASFADACRAKGVTVMHAPIAFEKGHHEISDKPYGILAGVRDGAAFENGTWGAEFCPAMTPKDGDLVVKGKSGLCGFESTNLDFLLRQRGIKNVILGGFLTNCCVESTMRSAYEKGYRVYTLKDCVAATSMAAQEATLEHNFGMFSVPTTSAEVLEAIVVGTQ